MALVYLGVAGLVASGIVAFWIVLVRRARESDADADQCHGDWVDLSRLPQAARGERFPRQ